MMTETNSTQILQELLTVPGINAVVIVGRDGFVIESAGQMLGRVDVDTVGASIATVVSGAESMGSELSLPPFHTVTLETDNATIMCTPVGDALLVVLAPDSKSLGMIRLQVKKRITPLAGLF